MVASLVFADEIFERRDGAKIASKNKINQISQPINSCTSYVMHFTKGKREGERGREIKGSKKICMFTLSWEFHSENIFVVEIIDGLNRKKTEISPKM